MIKKIETIVFGHRIAILAGLAAFTLVCGYYAFSLRLDAGFEKQLPAGHEYIQTFQEYRGTLFGSNRIIVVLKNRHGTIWNSDFFKAYKELSDDLFFLPGVARRTVTSLWTPNTRYLEITEEGIRADDVIPGTVTANNMTEANLRQIENNVIKGNFVGTLVAEDFTAAMVRADLQEYNPETRERLDYFDLAEQLETEIRGKYENDNYEILIIGFAKLIGDIADKADDVAVFFGIAFLLTALSVYLYSRSLILTFLPLFCSLVSVVWQFGLLSFLGYGLDPLAILVPFLVFAIGVSHGVQQINLITKEISAGATSEEAAHTSFSGLLVPGTMALVTDLVGFGTLYLIPIPMIQELSVTASIGVALKIVTNLIMLPILASYFRFDEGFVARVTKARDFRIKVMRVLGNVANPRIAVVTLGICVVLFVAAAIQSQDRHVGALHAGSPELHPDARYNLDSTQIVDKFALGLNILTVVVETPHESCINYKHMAYLDRLSWYMQNVDGVSLVVSLPFTSKQVAAGWNEGNLKWKALPRNKYSLVQAVNPVPPSSGLLTDDCSVMAQFIFLDDAKATTIQTAVAAVKEFREQFPAEWANLEIKTERPVEEALRDKAPAILDALDIVYGKVAASESTPVEIILNSYDAYYRNLDDTLVLTYPISDATPESITARLEAAGLDVASVEPREVNIRLASGNMGVQAAVNEEIEESELPMLLYVYATIIALVVLTYRDWRATVACCVPLTMATFMGYWFMKELEIGLTVATLPVMVLAVGLGVDYAFYIYNRIQFHLSEGMNMTDSYKQTLFETGMAVVFTAVTLAIGVSTWAFSGLKFQADMGLLLAFMFMINMVMAITALPSLAVVLDMMIPRRKPVKAPSGALSH